MLDTVSKHLRSLATLKQPTEYWDILLIYIFCNKLDKTTAREWEELKVNSLGTIAEDLPTLEDFKMFLKHKADLLETLELSKDTKVKAKGHSNTFTAVNCSCALCKGSHYIQNCSKFLKLPINERIEQVKKLRLCINCLRKNHVAKVCHSGKCMYVKA